MLDDPDKAAQLLAELKAAVPFNVILTRQLTEYLQARHVTVAPQAEHIVSDLSYAGDEGGIVCHLAASETGAALVVSLTHVLVPRSMPHSAVIRRYQKHRVKKLRKQGQA